MLTFTFGALLVAIPLAILILLARVSATVRDTTVERIVRWRRRRRPDRDASVQSTESFVLAVLNGSFKILRDVLLVAAVAIYVILAMSVFPSTRSTVDSVVSPQRLSELGQATIDYIPNAVRILLVILVANWVLRLNRFVFSQIEAGALRFQRFPSDWARPTHKLLRFPIVAAAVAIALPALPGANTEAFRGMIIFVGVLSGLGSTIATSNLVAGLVLTYTGAFSIGDRVQLGEAAGRVLDISLFATHIRTRRNEFVSIPNSQVLSGAVTNYSHLATEGYLLSTVVGLGYDVPWRRAYDLLLSAAESVEGVMAEPAPFVEQLSLDDFAVSYELSVYIRDDADPTVVRSTLHERIQDAFIDADVAILSPAFESRL